MGYRIIALELFGYPKTSQFYERNEETGRYYLVQYFERVRMEYHPELAGTPYEVQFGLLGTEMMMEQGLLDKTGAPGHYRDFARKAGFKRQECCILSRNKP